MGLLDLPFVRRIRRHHAIEHATINILASRHPGVHLAGRSDHRGFFVYGDVPTEEVRTAVEEALARLADEPELAVHPMCGTNMVVGGVLAGLTSLVAVSSLPRERSVKALDILPRLILAGTVASVATQPLGPLAQRLVTTLPEVAGLTVGRIEAFRRGRHVVHRVHLAGS